MMATLVELGLVGISRFDDFSNADHRRWISVTMVKQDVIADGHLAQKISRLIVPDPVPRSRLFGRARQILYRKDIRFRLDEPIASLIRDLAISGPHSMLMTSHSLMRRFNGNDTIFVWIL
jgi:hypothetical protein